MNQFRCPFWLCLAMAVISPAWGGAPEPLTLINAAPLDSADKVQPSGMALCRGQVLMISDKHDKTIYRIEENSSGAKAIAFQTLNDIPTPPATDLPFWQRMQRWLSSLWSSTYDWEGITCDASGNTFLLSESYVAVLQVPPTGSAKWVDLPLYKAGSKAGLFKKYNAFVEGISWSGRGLVIAAEREPRGLIELAPVNGKWNINRVSAITDTPIPAVTKNNRPDDFADTLIEDNHLFTLERNKSAICRRNLASFVIERCWSYSHIENAPELRYGDTRYGLAEGIAAKDAWLYVVFDNNGQGRERAVNDKRPILLKLALPTDWLTP